MEILENKLTPLMWNILCCVEIDGFHALHHFFMQMQKVFKSLAYFSSCFYILHFAPNSHVDAEDQETYPTFLHLSFSYSNVTRSFNENIKLGIGALLQRRCLFIG